MNIQQLIPTVREKLQFTWEFHRFMPEISGCYVLTTFDGTVLYAGLTNNLKRRFGEHRDSDDKSGLTEQGRAFWFYYLPCAEVELNRTERSWLNQHITEHGALPILNKMNSPVR